MTFKWPRGREYPLELHAGYHIGVRRIVVGIIDGRIKCLKPGREHDGAHLDGFFHRFHLVVNGLRQAGFHALVALRTDTAFETSLCLIFSLVLTKAEGNFVKVVAPVFKGERIYRDSWLVGLSLGIRFFVRPLLFPAFPKVYPGQVPMNALAGFLP